MSERSEKAKAAWEHVISARKNFCLYAETVDPSGYRELCDEGLLDEKERSGNAYQFKITPLGAQAAHHDQLVRSLSVDGPISVNLHHDALRNILARLGPPIA